VEKRSSGLDVREAVSFASIHVVEERVQRRFDYVEAKAVQLCRSKGGSTMSKQRRRSGRSVQRNERDDESWESGEKKLLKK
jgi:hypothetical protein